MDCSIGNVKIHPSRVNFHFRRVKKVNFHPVGVNKR